MNNLAESFATEVVSAVCTERQHTANFGVEVVRGGGTQRPLFLIHDIHGEVSYGTALLRYVDVDIPVYGLLGVMPHEELPHTMEALARRCILLMRELQSVGPYRVAGLLFGGILGYEIAVQLIGEDQEVEFLGLIDSVCPTLLRDASAMTSLPSIEEQLLNCCVENEDACDCADAIAWATLQSTIELDFEHVLQRCRAAGILPEYLNGKNTDQIRHHLGRLSAYRYAQQHYAVQQLPIPAHVFSFTQDSQPLVKLADPLKGWGAFLPRNRLHSIRVSGSPGSMLRPPHLASLGRELEVAIREATSDSSPRVTLLETSYCPHVSVQTGRRGLVPIFCVPGAGNSVTDFTAWAQAVGQEWPVHGLQPRGVSGDLVPHSTVQAAALQYLGAIDNAHPYGPLHLVGHSFGGWSVLELACLLRARGRKIASLTIIDGEAPDAQDPPRGDYTATEVLVELVNMIEMAVDQPLGIRAVDLAHLNEAGRLQLLHQALVRVGMMPARSKASALVGVVRTFGTALRTAYRPSAPYSGALRLVTVRDTRKSADVDKRRREKQVQDWLPWASRLSSWQGPGNHMTLLDHPHVAVVADWWRSGLCHNAIPES
jgi:thioesterase domain-containing protein